MRSLDFSTSLVLTLSVSAAFAGAGVLTAPVFTRTPAVRRMITANLLFSLALVLRWWFGYDVPPLAYVAVWSGLIAASSAFISALRWGAGQPDIDRRLLTGTLIGTGGLVVTGVVTGSAQWVGVFASVYSALTYWQGMKSARMIDRPSLHRARNTLSVVYGLCMAHSAAHLVMRANDLVHGIELIQPAAATYVALLWFCLALNVALLLVLYLQLVERVGDLALVDELTGLLNRRGMTTRMNARLETRPDSARAPEVGALVLVDIDHFKHINDDHGHVVGDQVLRWFAERLQASTRSHDLAVRLGGEEFCLLLPRSTPAQARDIAERIRHDLSEDLRFDPAGLNLRVTSSFGVAPLGTDAGGFAADLGRADRALYDAKRGGRDRVVVWQPGRGVAIEAEQTERDTGKGVATPEFQTTDA